MYRLDSLNSGPPQRLVMHYPNCKPTRSVGVPRVRGVIRPGRLRPAALPASARPSHIPVAIGVAVDAAVDAGTASSRAQDRCPLAASVRPFGDGPLRLPHGPPAHQRVIQYSILSRQVFMRRK